MIQLESFPLFSFTTKVSKMQKLTAQQSNLSSKLPIPFFNPLLYTIFLLSAVCSWFCDFKIFHFSLWIVQKLALNTQDSLLLVNWCSHHCKGCCSLLHCRLHNETFSQCNLSISNLSSEKSHKAG